MMRAATTAALLAAVALCASAGAQTTSPASAPTTASAPSSALAAWRTIWAHRFARADAESKLARKIAALPLGEGATVEDFLAEAPRRRTALGVLLAGAPDEGQARHDARGACEVAVALAPDALTEMLEALRGGFAPSNRFGAADLKAAAKALSATGRGQAPRALLGTVLIPKKSRSEYFGRADAATRRFWNRHVTPAGRLDAEQAAEADARRRLGRQIANLPVGKGTRLIEFIAGDATTDMGPFLRAARTRRIGYWPDAPVVECEVRVSHRTVYACLKAWALAHRPRQPKVIERIEGLIVSAADAEVVRVGAAGVPEKELIKPDAPMRRAAAQARSAPAWLHRVLRTTGRCPIASGATVAARQQAVRDAELAARVDLAERLMKLRIAGTTAGDLAARDAAFAAALRAFAHAVRRTGKPNVTAQAAEVVMELPLAGLWRLAVRPAGPKTAAP